MIIDTTAAVDKYIQDFLTQKSVEGNKLDPLFGDLLIVLTRFLKRGGKRLRPRLAHLAYQALGGVDVQAFAQIAASQELFHAFLLIHDDIIDKDIVRWGGPNISGHYRQTLHGTLLVNDVNHYADSSALMAGDVCHGFAQEMILTSSFNPNTIIALSTLLQQTLFETMAGELVDVFLPYEQWAAVDQARVMAVCVHKSARYSFMMPLCVGALTAGADSTQIKLLEKFGLQLGMAFQLRDDMLGMFGDEKILGKPVLSDMQEGKKTLLMYYGYRHANTAERKILNSIVGNANTGYEDLKKVQNILTSTGAVNETENIISDSVTKARRIFTTFTASNITAQPAAIEALEQIGQLISTVSARLK